MHTLKAAAHLVGIHPRTLRRWIKAGRVEASKVAGRHGEAWTFDREQLDALRNAAARDADLASVENEHAHQALDDKTPGADLAPFDSGALLNQLGALLDTQRNAAIDAERRAVAGELNALRAQVAEMRARLERAEGEARKARVTIAELRDAVKLATTNRVWREMLKPHAPPARATLPFTSGQLRALRSVI